jgi:type I restriction enzyme M protein
MRPYEDVAGFCASVPIARVAEQDYVLTPGRYVGLPEEDDFNFAHRFTAMKAELEAQLQEVVTFCGVTKARPLLRWECC